jgi:hypothetical protein
MDVKITFTRGGKKNGAKDSKSYTIPDVQTRAQVVEVLDKEFKEYFANVTTLDEVKPRSKKNTA